MPKASAKGSAMTVEELAAAEKRVEGKVSPFNTRTVVKDGKEMVIAGTPIKPAPQAEVIAPDGTVRTVVGMFTKPAKMGDSGTLKRFAHVPADRTGWIKMTMAQAEQYEKDRILVGYDSEQGLGLLSRTPTPIPEKKGV